MTFLQVTPLMFWEVINWLFVTFYWTILADLGQVVPTTYPIDRNNQLMFSSPSYQQTTSLSTKLSTNFILHSYNHLNPQFLP